MFTELERMFEILHEVFPCEKQKHAITYVEEEGKLFIHIFIPGEGWVSVPFVEVTENCDGAEESARAIHRFLFYNEIISEDWDWVKFP